MFEINKKATKTTLMSAVASAVSDAMLFTGVLD